MAEVTVDQIVDMVAVRQWLVAAARAVLWAASRPSQ
jgi:hypothetical protein